MVQGFFCYQVIDPFQTSKDFSSPVISATPCCLQQACLQSVCSQIIWHSIFFSSSLWMSVIDQSRLVAKNAYILVQKLNSLWPCRRACSRCTDIRSSASSLHLRGLFLCLWCFGWFRVDRDKLVEQVIFTCYVVLKSSYILSLLQTLQKYSILHCFCILQNSRMSFRSCLYEPLSWRLRAFTDEAFGQRWSNVFIHTS